MLASGGRFAITMAMNTGLQYSVELLPTEVRGQGVNFVNISGHLATIAAPLIVYVVRHISMYDMSRVIKGRPFTKAGVTVVRHHKTVDSKDNQNSSERCPRDIYFVFELCSNGK